MGTEKFIAFKEDGSAYRLKGRILRFLDNEPVSEADKTNIRSTLSVPASAEGLTPANNLSDLDSAATARTNLSVNSIDEDAQANGTKVTAPALYLNGSSSKVTVANSSILDFVGDGNDLPMTISGTILVRSNSTNFFVWAAWYSFREFVFYVDTNGKLTLGLSDGTNDTYALGSTVVPLNQVTHVAVTYPGAGPQSANDFPANQNGTKMYINGVAETVTPINNASYGGLVVRNQSYQIGADGSYFGQGSIRDCKIFNRTLTATEIAQLARGNDLGFSEEWAGAHGGLYTMDSTPSGEWTANANVLLSDEAGPIGGEADVFGITVNSASSNTKYAYRATGGINKRIRISGYAYIPSTNSNVDGVKIYDSGGPTYADLTSTTLDAWVSFSGESIDTTGSVRLAMLEAGSPTFTDAGSDDVVYFRDVTITEIGCLASFSAERYDTSTNKLYDLSDNAFVGTGTSVTLTGREVPVYETGTWTPSITFGGGSTGITYTTQEGFYTRIGDTVWVSAYVLLSSKGSDTGTALVNGLPFTASNSAASSQSLTVGNAANAASLTSAITAYVTDNGTTINLVDWGATGSAVLDDTNFAATTALSITGTYQIS